MASSTVPAQIGVKSDGEKLCVIITTDRLHVLYMLHVSQSFFPFFNLSIYEGHPLSRTS